MPRLPWRRAVRRGGEAPLKCTHDYSRACERISERTNESLFSRSSPRRRFAQCRSIRRTDAAGLSRSARGKYGTSRRSPYRRKRTRAALCQSPSALAIVHTRCARHRRPMTQTDFVRTRRALARRLFFTVAGFLLARWRNCQPWRRLFPSPIVADSAR